MGKIYLPQIDNDTREALNKVFFGAASKSIESLRKKGVTANCEVLLFSVCDGYAMYRVNGKMVRANFATATVRQRRAQRRRQQFWISNNSIQVAKYVEELNKKLALKIQLHDNVKKAKASLAKR